MTKTNTKTAFEKIVAYLSKRKTGATAPEIAKYAKVNYNTVRKLLGRDDFGVTTPKKCRVTGTYRRAYCV